MERRPEDIAADPLLREEFIVQESFDEWMTRMADSLEAKGEVELAEKLRADDYPEAIELWGETLDPATNVSEVYYLRGYTDVGQRHAHVGQVHAQLREAAIGLGVLQIEPSGVQEFNIGEE